MTRKKILMDKRKLKQATLMEIGNFRFRLEETEKAIARLQSQPTSLPSAPMGFHSAAFIQMFLGYLAAKVPRLNISPGQMLNAFRDFEREMAAVETPEEIPEEEE